MKYEGTSCKLMDTDRKEVSLTIDRFSDLMGKQGKGATQDGDQYQVVNHLPNQVVNHLPNQAKRTIVLSFKLEG